MQADLLSYPNARLRVLAHTAFWSAVVLYHALIYGAYSGSFATELTWQLVALPTKMGITYLALYVLLPRYFMTRRFVQFAFLLTLGVLAAAFLQRVVEFVLVREFSDPYQPAGGLIHPVKVLRAVIGIYPVVGIAAFVKVGKAWFRRDLQAETLRREKVEAELKFLRSQVQPHFLFNTLNNLYSLTLKKSDRAPEIVLKLSDMLSYVLYDGERTSVPLDREVEAIETYLALEGLRYGERLTVALEVNGDASSISVPPLLFLPFVENAFKHGISKQTESGSIHIDIEVAREFVGLHVLNSIPTADESSVTRNPERKNGIGLANVRRRLDLLYGSRYRLDIGAERQTFSVELRLPIRLSETTGPDLLSADAI